MDFIEHLPASDGFTSILVVVDHLTKQSLFIPAHDTISSPQLAQLFLTHICSKHGVPSHVTSDRGTKFVSHSSIHWASYSRWSSTSPLDITQREMAKPNTSTKCYNST